MGGKWAQKLQYGKEATAGTAVAATGIWRGIASFIDDGRNTVMPRYEDGLAVPDNSSYVPDAIARLALAETEATYEQLDVILSAGIEDQISGSADGSGSSGYLRTYDAHGASNTALNSLAYFTLESGDGDDVDEMEYSFVESFTLRGRRGEAVMVSANWIGRQATDTSFTGALTRTSVNEILAQLGTFAIDAAGGTIGNAAKTDTLLEWQLDVTTGWRPKWTLDNGEKYFSFAYFDRDSWDATLTLTYESNATAAAEKAAWRAETGRLIRIEITGPDYGTAGSGTTFSGKYGLRLDFAGKYESFGPMSSDEGNSTVQAVFKPRYSSTDSLAMQILLANETATTS